jgi:hypothetical protein
VVEQIPEEVEFLRSQLHLLASDGRFAPAGVDPEISVDQHRALELPALGVRTAEDRLHARDELPWVEGLREVVVRTDLEPDDLVDVLVPSAQHEDGDVGALTDATTDVDPVEVGKHQVEDDQRRRIRTRPLERTASRPDHAHGEPRPLEVHGYERCNARLVLDDEDRVVGGLGHERVW